MHESSEETFTFVQGRCAAFCWYHGRRSTGGAPSQLSKRVQHHGEFVAVIKARLDKAKGQAGRDQMTRLLHEDGIIVAVTTVGAIMR